MALVDVEGVFYATILVGERAKPRPPLNGRQFRPAVGYRTFQLGRYQGPRWPQAARWAQCTYRYLLLLR
jgi:hypothetical protein